MKEFLEKVSQITGKRDKELADSVLEVSVRANKEIVNQLKGEGDSMCQALLEIMEPEINEIRKNDVIAQLISTTRELGLTDDKIESMIESRFGCSQETAKNKIREFDEGIIKVPFQAK